MAARSLAYHYKTATVLTKIIAINVIIFLLVRLLAFFFGVSAFELTSWFVLPENLGEFIVQPWSIITYSFLHSGIFHILFNMYILYWFGRIVLNLFSERKFLAIYLLGAISGGLLYMLAYNLFPIFTGASGYLLGASAAVRAIMIFIAAYSPETEVMIFKWRVRLWHIGIVVIFLDVVQIPMSGNAGGLIAHLGGALFGYIYGMQLGIGNDFIKWFENILERFEGWKPPPQRRYMKTVHRNETKSRSAAKKDVSSKQKQVDAILDKIGKSGYDSLTKAEKDFLFKAGKDD